MNPSTRVYYLHNANDVNGSMTNRDYIAVQAMTALLASAPATVPDRHRTPSKIAALAYSYADAMIQQSEMPLSHDKKCTPQMIAECDCEGDIAKCQGACYK